MLKYIDAHCHLQNIENLVDTFNSANSVGICGFICNATSPNDWDRILNLTNNYKNVSACIGVHPWYIQSLRENWSKDMYSILRSDSTLMIGEIGLDKFYPDIDLQKKVFIEQLEIACNLNRSVHIHCVGAWDIILMILKSYKNYLPRRIIFHSFSGSVEIQDQLLRYKDVYFSYSDMVLDNRRKRFVKSVTETPTEKILVESDDKSPLVIIDIVRRIGEIKKIAPEKIADTIYMNSIGILKNG